MNIEIHPEAKKNFDVKSQNLLNLISEMPPRKSTTESINPDFHIEHIFTEKDIIGEFKVSLVNSLGKEVGKVFNHNKKEYGITDENYLKLLRLSEDIQKNNSLKELISVDFVKEELFAWITKSFKESNKTSFIDYLLQKAENAIKHYEVWIPIPFTTIQSQFSLGKITFKIVSKEQIEEWFEYFNNQDGTKNIEKYKEKFKKNFQGYAAGVYRCDAEPIRAQELAFFHINNSLGILRLFSPANHLLGLISGVYEYGKNMIKSKTYFITNKDKKLFTESSEFLDQGLHWNISNFVINMLNSEDFKNFHVLLNCDNPNEFQKKLLEALLIYSRNTLRRELFDKILYILVALESFLLKNDSEPIQQNVGDRMAFTIGKSPDERRKIVQTLKDIYSIRSRFIHHGAQSFEDTELIQRFMNYAWLTFCSLVQNSHIFKTKDECIFALEHIKYS